MSNPICGSTHQGLTYALERHLRLPYGGVRGGYSPRRPRATAAARDLGEGIARLRATRGLAKGRAVHGGAVSLLGRRQAHRAPPRPPDLGPYPPMTPREREGLELLPSGGFPRGGRNSQASRSCATAGGWRAGPRIPGAGAGWLERTAEPPPSSARRAASRPSRTLEGDEPHRRLPVTDAVQNGRRPSDIDRESNPRRAGPNAVSGVSALSSRLAHPGATRTGIRSV